MDGSPAASGPVRLLDLGFGRGWLAGALAACVGAPAAVALQFGASWPAALTTAAVGAGALAAAIALGMRRLRRELLAPLEEITRAMDQLRNTGRPQRLLERGASVLQPIMRRFNLAVLAVEQRDRMSQANLMSVEAAFDRVHAVLQSLREIVIVIDPGGRIVLANRSARSLLKNGDQQLEGRELAELLADDLRVAFADGVARLESNAADEIRTADLPHQGRIYDLTMVQVQSNRADQDFGKVVVLADVTRNHEVNRLKDELLSSISHELRTPLTTMCSSSEILASLTATDENEWREFATVLNAESRRLKELVDDVMEYSQLETHRVEWRHEPVEVTALVRTAVDLMHGAAAKKNIELSCTLGPAATAMVDAQRLREALGRLLDNAIKFTPSSGKVHVQTSLHDELVDVAVGDSGVGIAAADRQRVFERFSQIGNVMTEKPAGTGLGLSITQRIIDALGGTIWCEESPLGGAQFRFVLPLQTTTAS